MTKFSYLKGVVLMNTKKIFAMIIALIMTTAIFAGCGNSVDHKDTEVSSTVDTTIDKDVDKTVEEKSDEKSETAEKANATETADKKDSKETSNKAEKPNDNKVTDKSDKDKGSANNSNSSVSKPNSGNANHNSSASKPSTPAKPNKPSGNNSGSSNNGNHNGSVNKPSKPVEKPVEKPSEPSKPVEKPVEKPSEKPTPHVHNFNIWKNEMSHTEMVTEEYTEQVPKYKYEAHYVCKKCGFNSTDIEVIGAHCLDCDSTYKHVAVQVQDGFETVTKTREVPKTIVDDPAHYECSCGARQ